MVHVPRDCRTAAPVDAGPLLEQLAARLAEGGPDVLPDALDQLVDALALRSAVLRDVAPTAKGGALLAVAGDVVHAVPRSRELVDVAAASSVVELPVRADGRAVAALTVVGARPSQLPALRACTSVLALALRPTRDLPSGLALGLLAAAEDDADDVADALHDGPVQELVAARYATDVAVRGGDTRLAREAVQTALQSLRRALWMLRPRVTVDGGLAPALTHLSERLQEAGRPALLLDLDADACAALPAPCAAICYRLVQAVAGRAGDPATTVRVTRRADSVRLEAGAAVPLPAPERWSVRAAALGAELLLPDDPPGRFVLSVPPATRTAPAPDDIEATP